MTLENPVFLRTLYMKFIRIGEISQDELYFVAFSPEGFV